MTKLIAPESAKEDVHSEFMQDFNGLDGQEKHDAPTNGSEEENGSLKNDNEKEGKTMTASGSNEKAKAKVRKSMDNEERDKFAEYLAAKFEAGKLKDNSVRLTYVSKKGNCDKNIAKDIVLRAMDKAKAYIKMIDDKPSTSVPSPHVNKQDSLIIPAKTMKGIVNDKKEMIFPEGTQFSMEHDADTIILTKIA